ncbi:hypothetical protein BKA56DRAFT_573657 [Ilyonectria sp. MPI-CAGE-AT-0026]|nr:hypothetical protein BKA56DRAFT_573657 [Ilyonectria sp. MPI-CAGE-AT-0026]
MVRGQRKKRLHFCPKPPAIILQIQLSPQTILVASLNPWPVISFHSFSPRGRELHPFISQPQADVTHIAIGVGAFVVIQIHSHPMSLASSPPRDIIELLARRNLTSIPKDQQVLLDKPDSWAIDLKGKPHGLVNVPGHVLETAKKAYIAQTSATTEPQTQLQVQSQVQLSSQLPLPSTTRNSSPSGPTSSHDVPPTQNGHSEDPSEPREEFIEWSVSPEREPRLPQLPQIPVESSIVRETPKAAPMAPPPRPALPFSFPSSDGPEEDLEVDIPQPQLLQDTPVNRAAARLQATVDFPTPSGTHPMATPPCAQPSHPTQPTIPNTVVAGKPAAEFVPSEQRRERRMKAIQFNDKTPRKIQPGLNRLAPTKTFTQIESSDSTSPSSIIPATFEEPPSQGSVLQSVEISKDMDMDDAYDQEENDDMEVIIEQSQIQAPISGSYQSERASPHFPPPFPQITLSGDIEPFKVFTMVYPTYTENHSGTLWDFIKTCVYLDWLRRRRQLRDYLYDDFIRAFANYQVYVRNARTGQEALVAIEWFNNLSGPPVFNNMVVTKENLSYILDSYPKEVAKASKLIVEEDGSDEEVIETRQAPLGLDGIMDVDRREALRRPISTPALTSASRPRGILTQAPPPPSPSWNSTALPSTVATPATRTRPSRASQYFGRLASSVSSSSTPRRRTVEERAKLREHFLRRKSADSRSVTSSRFRQ